MANLEAPKMSNSETTTPTPEKHIGFLDVFIHEARDIQNICIYHKQDVYAKISLTTSPKSSVSTQTINGGGRNPVFNQNLQLDVENIDSSLRCEVWMLSRVKNYLEDQLLGFTLIPLSDIFMSNNKLAQEFSLSTNDLFHSPSGFIQLSISYTGSSPEILDITPRAPRESDVQENEECNLDKIEFPDLNVDNENKMMISEYFGVPCTELDVQCNEETNNEAGVRVVECFANANATSPDSVEVHESTPVETENGTMENVAVPPVISINVQTEEPVKQQDFVDMYMKSMQEFTESLANMKLPMDLQNNSSSSCSSSSSRGENSGETCDMKLQEPKKATGSRVFYGSRAFF